MGKLLLFIAFYVSFLSLSNASKDVYYAGYSNLPRAIQQEISDEIFSLCDKYTNEIVNLNTISCYNPKLASVNTQLLLSGSAAKDYARSYARIQLLPLDLITAMEGACGDLKNPESFYCINCVQEASRSCDVTGDVNHFRKIQAKYYSTLGPKKYDETYGKVIAEFNYQQLRANVLQTFCAKMDGDITSDETGILQYGTLDSKCQISPKFEEETGKVTLEEVMNSKVDYLPLLSQFIDYSCQAFSSYNCGPTSIENEFAGQLSKSLTANTAINDLVASYEPVILQGLAETRFQYTLDKIHQMAKLVGGHRIQGKHLLHMLNATACDPASQKKISESVKADKEVPDASEDFLNDLRPAVLDGLLANQLAIEAINEDVFKPTSPCTFAMTAREPKIADYCKDAAIVRSDLQDTNNTILSNWPLLNYVVTAESDGKEKPLWRVLADEENPVKQKKIFQSAIDKVLNAATDDFAEMCDGKQKNTQQYGRDASRIPIYVDKFMIGQKENNSFSKDYLHTIGTIGCIIEKRNSVENQALDARISALEAISMTLIGMIAAPAGAISSVARAIVNNRKANTTEREFLIGVGDATSYLEARQSELSIGVEGLMMGIAILGLGAEAEAMKTALGGFKRAAIQLNGFRRKMILAREEAVAAAKAASNPALKEADKIIAQNLDSIPGTTVIRHEDFTQTVKGLDKALYPEERLLVAQMIDENQVHGSNGMNQEFDSALNDKIEKILARPKVASRIEELKQLQRQQNIGPQSSSVVSFENLKRHLGENGPIEIQLDDISMSKDKGITFKGSGSYGSKATIIGVDSSSGMVKIRGVDKKGNFFEGEIPWVRFYSSIDSVEMAKFGGVPLRPNEAWMPVTTYRNGWLNVDSGYGTDIWMREGEPNHFRWTDGEGSEHELIYLGENNDNRNLIDFKDSSTGHIFHFEKATLDQAEITLIGEPYGMLERTDAGPISSMLERRGFEWHPYGGYQTSRARLDQVNGIVAKLNTVEDGRLYIQFRENPHPRNSYMSDNFVTNLPGGVHPDFPGT